MLQQRAVLRRKVRCSSLSPPWPISTPMPTRSRRGWSPDNVRLEEAAREELELDRRRSGGLRGLARRPRGQGADPSPCPTARRCRACRATGAGCGTANSAARSAFAGSPAPSALPPHCLGHIGYSRRALEARPRLRHARAGAAAAGGAQGRASTMSRLTTDPDNLPSQKVITANGGVLVKRFRKDAGLRRGRSAAVSYPASGRRHRPARRPRPSPTAPPARAT